MNPEIELLSVIQIHWDSLRATMDKVLGTRAQVSDHLSEDAEYLINLATFHKIQYNDPLTLLRRYPNYLLKFLHYSFMVACSEKTYTEFSYATRCSIIPNRKDDVTIFLVAGTLDEWYNTVVYNSQTKCEITILINKILTVFEKRGLGYLFERYKKVPLRNGTFLLEKR